MGRKKKVIVNSFFYTLATVLQGMISFLLLPVYTKILSPDDYAMIALVSSFTGIVSSLITLQIHTGIPRFVIKFLKDGDRAKNYFTGIFLILSAILLSGCALINVFGDKIVRAIFSDKNALSYSPLFLIATWTLLPNLLIGAGALLLQTLEKGGKFFMVNLAQVIFNVAFGIYFVVFLRTGVIGVLYAQLIGSVAGLICVVWFTRDWLGLTIRKFSVHDLRDSFRYSLPIIPHMLSIYIYMYSDRLILQRFVPLSAIGIYSIASTFAYVLLIIVNATTTAYSPRFLKLAEENKDEARAETRDFIEIWWVGITVIFMGYLFLSKYVVELMTKPSFFACVPFIPILAAGYIFRGLYCFCANGIFFREKTNLIPIITVSAALINVGMNLAFIPRYGVYAAAWDTFFSYFITFVMSFYLSRNCFPLLFPWKNMFKVSILMVALYFVKLFFEKAMPGYFYSSLLFNLFLFLVYMAIVAAVLYRQYSVKILKSVLNSLKAQSIFLQDQSR